MKEEKYLIGYVDEESPWIDKFQFNLNEAFNIKVFPLTEEVTLDQLVSDILAAKLDCLIVDYELKEAALIPFNGDEIIEEIRKRYPLFPVFIITSKEEDYVLTMVEDNEIVRLKDELTDRPQILSQRIQNKINNYYSEIEKAKTVINKYTDLKQRGIALSPEQEEVLFSKYLFLEKVYPDEKLLPDSLSAPESVNKLNEFIAQTKLVLEELKKANR